MLSVGENIGKFTIQRVLGQGGMAIVYLVEHAQLGSKHALKVLTVGAKAITERMMQEGRVQATLRHPNVVAVHDVLDIAGQPALLMEFIDGPALDEFLFDQSPAAAVAARIFEGTAAGVHKAHEQGLIHRDLKPGNILLQRSGRDWIAKVTDFGLAKMVEGDTNLSKTRSGVAMGTPSYMSPEQIVDAKNVDKRTDVWALGAILYELYTGRQCFEGENILEIFNKVSEGAYVEPTQLNPDIPSGVLQAILGALQTDRDRRIPDAQTLLDVMRGDASFAVEAGVRAHNPTLLPDSFDLPTHGETLAPDLSNQTLVRGEETVLQPDQANQTIHAIEKRARGLEALGISQSTIDPVAHRNDSLPLILGAMLLTAAAIGLGVFFGVQQLQPAELPPEIVAIRPVPAVDVAPTSAPVAPAPAPPPAVVPAPRPTPVVRPAAPAPKPVPSSRPTIYAGVAGSRPMKLTITGWRGDRFDGTVLLGGHTMGVRGSASKGSVQFAETAGEGRFTGTSAGGKWQGHHKRQPGASEEQWFLQPR